MNTWQKMTFILFFNFFMSWFLSVHACFDSTKLNVKFFEVKDASGNVIVELESNNPMTKEHFAYNVLDNDGVLTTLLAIKSFDHKVPLKNPNDGKKLINMQDYPEMAFIHQSLLRFEKYLSSMCGPVVSTVQASSDENVCTGYRSLRDLTNPNRKEAISVSAFYQAVQKFDRSLENSGVGYQTADGHTQQVTLTRYQVRCDGLYDKCPVVIADPKTSINLSLPSDLIMSFDHDGTMDLAQNKGGCGQDLESFSTLINQRPAVEAPKQIMEFNGLSQ